jgi:hypothetical protein
MREGKRAEEMSRAEKNMVRKRKLNQMGSSLGFKNLFVFSYLIQILI